MRPSSFRSSASSILLTVAKVAGDAIVLLFAMLTVWASFAVDEPDAYAFPQLLSLLLLLFAGINMARKSSRTALAAAPPPPLSAALLAKIMPATAVIVVYLAVAEALGFYFSAFFAFALLSFLYGGGDKSDVRNAVLVAAAFVAVLYALFSLLLGVQLPRGFFL